MSGQGSREEGLRLLQARLAELPHLVRSTLATPMAIGADIACRRIVATGVGSSAAHARFLASVLNELGVAARFAPATTFLAPPSSAAATETLVVFSQGISPNVRPALAHPGAWRQVWLVTSAHDPVAGSHRAPGGDEDVRRRLLREATAAGVRVLSYPGADEYGTLLRVVGPMTGYAAALGFAAAVARSIPSASESAQPHWLDVDPDVVAARISTAAQRIGWRSGELDSGALECNLALLASGVHGERIENLRLKIVEGMFRPAPPVWDLLDLAHGPFQQLFGAKATLLAFLHADGPADAELLARLRAMLDPQRHRLVPLVSDLPGPLAIFEHEAMLNALVLAYIAERNIDPCNWPGKGRDGPLYEFQGMGAGPASDKEARDSTDAQPAALQSAEIGPSASGSANRSRRLEEMTWPEVEQFVSSGRCTAVLALGSTEQHGPHLPLATDTWIASELARRLVARLEDALELPVLALGCAREHLSFPGTLSLEEETLASVLCDVAASLARQGFARLFVFSAHGGNRQALAAALPRMRAVAPDLTVFAAPGLGVSMEALHGASARHGIAAGASGHHAGEFETSILLGIRAGTVRAGQLAAGLEVTQGNVDGIFYPDLRASAVTGVVGDPTGADGARAHEYLETWVESLLTVYRREESRANTNGRKNA